MRLEEIIKQTKGFKNEFEKLIVNLHYRNSVISNRLEYFFKKYHITKQQYNILRILRGIGTNAISINELKERMIEQNSDVSRLISRLDGKGLVERCTCNMDRRQMDIKITVKGLNLLNDLDYKIDDFNYLIPGITEQEAKLVNDILDKIK